MTARDLMLTGGHDWERYTFAGACNEPLPSSWKNACRRRVGHPGTHHTWDPRTGLFKSRWPIRGFVMTWGRGPMSERRMLGRRAYVAPVSSDRLMASAIQRREHPR